MAFFAAPRNNIQTSQKAGVSMIPPLSNGLSLTQRFMAAPKGTSLQTPPRSTGSPIS